MNNQDFFRLLILGSTVYFAKQADAVIRDVSSMPSDICARLYQFIHFDIAPNGYLGGDYLDVYPGEGELGKQEGTYREKTREWNDKISSIKVNKENGCTFVAFEDHKKQKQMWQTAEDIDNLQTYPYEKCQDSPDIPGYDEGYDEECVLEFSNDRISSYQCDCDSR